MANKAEIKNKYLDKNCFSVTHKKNNSYSMKTFHLHNVFEIYFSQTDDIKYFVNNRIYSVQRNDMFIFNNIDLHRISIPPDTYYDRYIILFNPDYITDMCTQRTDLLKCFTKRNQNFCHRIHLSGEEVYTFKKLFHKAHNYTKDNQYGSDIYKKIALAETLIFINNLYKNNEYIDLNVSIQEPMYDKVKPIIMYINENSSNQLTLEHLANHFFISKYHLCKIFKQVSRFSVNEYIIYQRVLNATQLLRANYKVSEVCTMVGFNNISHFITTFKNKVGISPKQYGQRYAIHEKSISLSNLPISRNWQP